jgi:steroid delta-isomerase-like uncharacterized protein
MTTVDADLRAKREEIVSRHVAAEALGDVPTVIGTFAPGRVSYDVPFLSAHFDGADAVSAYLGGMLSVLTEMKVNILHTHHADDAVISELSIEATHSADYQGIAPTGKRVTVRMCGVFRFEGEDLWQETVYLDNESIKAQLVD